MIRKSIVFIFVISYLVALVSCQTAQSVNVDKNKFFDIESYVDTLMSRQGTEFDVRRTIILDGEKETTELSDYDMTETFIYLKKFNINQPRLYDKYNVEDKGNKTVYTALKEDLNVRKCEVSRTSGKVERIYIDYKVGTMISASEKQIEFIPGQILSVNNKNVSRVSKNSDMTVTWEFQ